MLGKTTEFSVGYNADNNADQQTGISVGMRVLAAMVRHARRQRYLENCGVLQSKRNTTALMEGGQNLTAGSQQQGN